jgi:ectoine hydroxylase-related dioxygenase (phytanoyl-CoA dioxygenase family)
VTLFEDERDLAAAKRVFLRQGYCVFKNLLGDEAFGALLEGVNAAISEGKLVIRDNKMNVNDDAVFANPAIEATCKHPSLVMAAKAFVDHPVTLQHAKFNAKPKHGTASASEVEWHQDFPFFPHSNHDLVACVIHLDDEHEGSGAMSFVPGSHLLGEQTHTDEHGNFIYRCADPDHRYAPPELLLAKRGWVSFHHALTLHCSEAKTNNRDRRLIVFQYRAYDALQLAGVLWRCNGYHVDDDVPDFPVARFPDGTSISLRGRGGRLFDLFGALKPNSSPKSY